MSNTYDTDFHAWTTENAALIRQEQVSKVDFEHIVEELESIGGSERQALSSRLMELLMHLLKWKYQPERRGSSWVTSMDKQRIGIDALLEESLSLKYQLPERFKKVYKARRYTAVETRLPLATFPEDCPFSPVYIEESAANNTRIPPPWLGNAGRRPRAHYRPSV